MDKLRLDLLNNADKYSDAENYKNLIKSGEFILFWGGEDEDFDSFTAQDVMGVSTGELQWGDEFFNPYDDKVKFKVVLLSFKRKLAVVERRKCL